MEGHHLDEFLKRAGVTAARFSGPSRRPVGLNHHEALTPSVQFGFSVAALTSEPEFSGL